MLNLRPIRFRLSLLTLLFLATGCLNPDPGENGGDAGGGGGGEPSPSPTAEPAYPPPRDDLVPQVGREDTIDVATWNIENFPQTSDTPLLVADLITSMALDLVVVEEIADQDAFEELVARLPNHAGVLSGHTYGDGSYQKIGFIYRADLLAVTDVTQIYSGSGYAFPRPPLFARVSVLGTDLDFTVIGVHLKAGTGADERERRTEAVRLLDTFVQSQVDGAGDDDVMIIGDFNEVLTTGSGREVFAPLLETDRYAIQTATLAQTGQGSFLGGNRFIDHIVTTVQMEDEVGGYFAQLAKLDEEMSGYESQVSDHRPVILPLPVP